MAFVQPITYNIMQDVQYYNNVEITSHVISGERFYRAYSLFNAAAKESINKSIRKAMIARLGRMASEHGGGILMARFKAPNAWFLSTWLLQLAVDTANPVDARDNRRRKQGDWHDYEISDLMAALELAEILDGRPADKSPWPVAMLANYSGLPETEPEHAEEDA